jgi:hypothetical protein
MTANNDLLILATDRDTFYAWQVDENDGPTLLQSNQTHIVSRFARHMAFSEDESLLSVSQSTASVHRITSASGSIPGQIAALFQTLQSSFAIQKNEKSIFLLEAATGNEIHLVENASRITRFCADGQANLLYACSDGTGFVLNCIAGSRYPVNAAPSTLAAAVGDPNGGFWMADRLGNIHHMDIKGSNHFAYTLDPDNSRVQELLHTGDVLVWRGWFNDETIPEGRPDTLFFFGSDRIGQLKQVGRRIFSKSDGFIETIAYDFIKNSLLVIFNNSTRGITEIRTGSIDDFILKRESHKTIEWVQDQVKAAQFSSGSTIYMLSNNGTVYCADSNTWERKAVLSPSLPFQVMSLDCSNQAGVLLSDSKSDIFSCRLESG